MTKENCWIEELLMEEAEGDEEVTEEDIAWTRTMSYLVDEGVVEIEQREDGEMRFYRT